MPLNNFLKTFESSPEEKGKYCIAERKILYLTRTLLAGQKP